MVKICNWKHLFMKHKYKRNQIFRKNTHPNKGELYILTDTYVHNNRLCYSYVNFDYVLNGNIKDLQWHSLISEASLKRQYTFVMNYNKTAKLLYLKDKCND